MDRHRVQKLIRLYEEGLLSEIEITNDFIEEYLPEEIAADLPPGLLLAIRTRTSPPPLTFEQAPRSFRIGDGRTEEHRTNDRWQAFENVWCWHRYFQSRQG